MHFGPKIIFISIILRVNLMFRETDWNSEFNCHLKNIFCKQNSRRQYDIYRLYIQYLYFQLWNVCIIQSIDSKATFVGSKISHSVDINCLMRKKKNLNSIPKARSIIRVRASLNKNQNLRASWNLHFYF